jgi:hypothetical protein
MRCLLLSRRTRTFICRQGSSFLKPENSATLYKLGIEYRGLSPGEAAFVSKRHARVKATILSEGRPLWIRRRGETLMFSRGFADALIALKEG